MSQDRLGALGGGLPHPPGTSTLSCAGQLKRFLQLLCIYCTLSAGTFNQPQVLYATGSLSLVGDASTCGPSVLCTCAGPQWLAESTAGPSRHSALDRIRVHALMLMLRMEAGCTDALQHS